jgi:hypothetical protein
LKWSRLAVSGARPDAVSSVIPELALIQREIGFPRVSGIQLVAFSVFGLLAFG